MSRRVLQFSLAIAVVCVMSIPVLARPNSKESLSTTIDLITAVNIGNKMVEPGEYKVVAENNRARFEKDGKVIAQVPCTLKTLPAKAHDTEVAVDSNQLTEIRISGKTQAMEFSGS